MELDYIIIIADGKMTAAKNHANCNFTGNRKQSSNKPVELHYLTCTIEISYSDGISEVGTGLNSSDVM